MSVRRRASELIFKKSHALRYPVNCYAAISGTGTVAKAGTVFVLAASVATRAYCTLAATTNIGTIIGTAAVTY
jgi:hypothetical protein